MRREDVLAARDDFGLFCELVGRPRTEWQLTTMKLATRQTIVVSPRQCGKSETLSLKATHTAFRKPQQFVLIVSAGEEAAARLLRVIRDVCSHELLKGAVVDETQHRVVLTNGSEIRSVPASERQVRGWSVDLLIVDEAAFVSEDLLLSAALPTTAARPDARIILASSPWGDAGPFYALAVQGMEANPHVRTFRWKLADAWWIAESVVEAARATMSPLRFRAEYEGEFIASGDAYFDRDDVLACVADFPLQRHGSGMPGSMGLDWGRRQDAHAVAIAGLLDDFGVNGRSVLVVPWVETSRRPYSAQVAEIEDLTRSWDLTIRTETNGVGQYPAEELARRLGGRIRVTPSATTQTRKEDAYGRVRILLTEGAIVLPRHEELLRQLGGITATPTPAGGLKIGARLESIHDDLPDAVTLAVSGLPKDLAEVPRRDPAECDWVETTAGIMVPLPIRLLAAEADWTVAYAPEAFAPKPAEEQPNPWDEVYGAEQNPLRQLADWATPTKGL